MALNTRLQPVPLRCLSAFVLGITLVFAIGATTAAGEDMAAGGPPIRSGAEIDYPPFSFVDESGEATGFSVELMRAALAAMGREASFRTGPWSEVRGWLERGEIQALPLVGRTPEREALFDFTVPYMSLHGAIVVRKGEAGIRDLTDLRGRRVAVMKGDNAEEFLRREDRGIDIHTTPTFEVALRELSEGRFDAVVIQRLVALRLINKTGLTDLRVVERPIDGFQQDFCFAVREGDRETLALLNEGLAIVVADGTHRHLHARWFAAMELPSDRPIVVGGDRNFPPYEFLDKNGRPAGYNVDLTRAIARELGLDVEIRLGRWTERVQALKNGEIDVLQGMFYSPDRDLVFDFTQAHTASHYVAVVRQGEGPPPDSIQDLTGMRIVVEDGDILHDFAVEHGLTDGLVLVDDQEEALRELAEGRHDCAIVSRLTALYLIDRYEWPRLVPGKKPLLEAEYCYATATDQSALLAQFAEGLKAVEGSGEYRRIHEKWLGVYESPPTPILVALRYSAVVLVPLVLVLLAAFLWSWSLRRKVAERTNELRESLERFRYVFEAANVGKSMTLPSGEVNANRAFADFLGYAPEELRGKRWQDLTPDEDIEVTERAIGPLMAGEKDAARFEKRYIHKNGQPLWADVSVAMRRDAEGKPLYFMTTVVDINEKKAAKEALRKSEEYQRAMIACSPVALYTVDLEGNVLTWNSSAERIFGWSAEEIIGKPLPIVSDEKREEFNSLRRHVLERGGFFGKELIRVRKDGTEFPVSLSAAPVRNDRGEIVGILGAAEDITERKHAQVRIEHLNQVLRAIRDVNQLIVRERDRDTLIREGCRLLVSNRGYPSALIVLTDNEDRPIFWAMGGLAAASEEMAGIMEQGALPACCDRARDEHGVLLVDDRETVCAGCPIAESCAEGQSLCTPLIHEGETYGFLAAAAEKRLVVDEEERNLFAEMADDLAYAIGVMRIEDARRQGEAALRESEEKYSTLVEGSLQGVVIAQDGPVRLSFANAAMENLCGYSVDELLSMGPSDLEALIHPDDRERFFGSFKRRMAGESVPPVAEYRLLRKDSEMAWVICYSSAIDYFGEAATLTTFIDITGRKQAEAEHEKLQAQLIHSQKMESVGRLAGGVAHDFNNMLSVIIGFSEIALSRTAPEDPLRGDLEEILGAAKRSSDITRQLLAFARQQTIAPNALELNDTVEGLLKMLRRLIGEDIDLLWQPCRGRLPVFMDPSQLDQILANLCVNARDAIDGVGKITIETGDVRFDEEYCAHHAGFVPGDFAMLAVSDDGCGMDRDALNNIFEPFFTTKGVGEGTGLGLSTVFGIVKQNKGFINVYSEPGKGTTFKIYLRLHAGQGAGTDARDDAEVPAGRGETVLVVEDEASILKLAGRILNTLGYTVLTASTPGEAIAAAEEHAGRIHLLITDVVMPEMNGRELAENLRAQYPALKVLFMSGYTANVIAHRGVLDEGVNFMQKPFSNRDLAVKVREALEN